MKNRAVTSLNLLILLLAVVLVLSACVKASPTPVSTPPAVSSPTPTPTPVPAEQPAQTMIDMTVDLLTSGIWDAQTFTVPAKGYVISGASLNISKIGSPPNPLAVSIRATDGKGHPTGSDLTKGAISVSSVRAITDSLGFVDVNFNAPYELKGNTKYALVIYSSGESNNNFYSWWIQRSDVFGGGNLEQSADSGSTWTSQPYDAAFKMNIAGGTQQQ